MGFNLNKAMAAKEKILNSFIPSELNEGNVRAIFNRCGKANEDGSADWDQEKLAQNKAYIRYLLGQLALVHEGVTEHKLDGSFFRRYDGTEWTDSRGIVIYLLNMGGKSGFCSFFKKDNTQFVELKINKLKPTLSPKDAAFSTWWEKNGAEFEAEYAFALGKKARDGGDYAEARSYFETAQAKGLEDAKYELNWICSIEENLSKAQKGDVNAQYLLASFYDVPDALMWLDKAIAQGHKGAVAVRKLLQKEKLSVDEQSYLRENYMSLSSSLRNAYDAYMAEQMRHL